MKINRTFVTSKKIILLFLLLVTGIGVFANPFYFYELKTRKVIEKSDYLLISDVAPFSPAERAGLKVNDRILEVNGVPEKEINDFYSFVYTPTASQATLVVQRETQVLPLTIVFNETNTHTQGGETGLVVTKNAVGESDSITITKNHLQRIFGKELKTIQPASLSLINRSIVKNRIYLIFFIVNLILLFTHLYRKKEHQTILMLCFFIQFLFIFGDLFKLLIVLVS